MRKRTYLALKKVLVRLVAIGIVLGALYVYFRTGFFTIHSYVIKGAPNGYGDTLTATFTNLEQKKLYKILPGNRTISFHKKDMVLAVEGTLPNTKHISIYPSGLHTVTVSLSSYTPVFRMKDNQAISADGAIYKEIAPHDELPLVELASSSLSKEEILSLENLSTKINTVLFPISTITLDEYGDVRLSDRSSASVITTMTANTDKVWSTILSAIDTEPLKSELADPSKKLLYLDARFGNKVFYKFTSGSGSAIIPPHATSTASTTAQ